MPGRRPGFSVEVLRKRAELLRKIRSFFYERGVLEVDTPAVSRYPSIDRHLDPLTVQLGHDRPARYLITSPEYHMKRLLCDGCGSIFQLCKAFRRDEAGQRHNPEFTILEWYRVGWNHHQLMDEVDELLHLILRSPPAERLPYVAVFDRYAGVDPRSLSVSGFSDCCRKNDLSPSAGLVQEGTSSDDRLDFLMAMVIEPQLGVQRPAIVYDYPASQASLARIHPADPWFSERFEVFYRGMELGNGFHELADAAEQRARFEAENQLRREMGKQPFSPDEEFLAALSRGLPDCAGIAMGFDRLLMLSLGFESIDDVTAFPWNRS